MADLPSPLDEPESVPSEQPSERLLSSQDDEEPPPFRTYEELQNYGLKLVAEMKDTLSNSEPSHLAAIPLLTSRSLPLPPPPSPAPQSLSSLEALSLLLGHMRDIRAEAQNLQRSVSDVKLKSKLTGKKTRSAELEAALLEEYKIFSYNDTQIEVHLVALRIMMERYPSLYDLVGDEITHIQNIWQRVSLNWPDLPKEGQPFDDATVVRQLDKIVELLSELILQAAKLTIPNRINQHLGQLRIGQALEFHREFSDELPRSQDRQEVLHYLHAHPTVIEGVVDIEHGLVHRASPKHVRRFLSYILIVAVIIVGALFVSLLHTWGILLTGQTLENLLRGYFAVIVGGICHVGIDALKQARASKERTFTALGDWLLWIHIKELPIIVGIVSLWVGFLGLAFSTQRMDWQTAFFVGYSIDSVIDLFLQRFSKAASTYTKAL